MTHWGRRKLRLALGAGGERWAAPLIHGAWQQRSLAVLGRALTVRLDALSYTLDYNALDLAETDGVAALRRMAAAQPGCAGPCTYSALDCLNEHINPSLRPG